MLFFLSKYIFIDCVSVSFSLSLWFLFLLWSCLSVQNLMCQCDVCKRRRRRKKEKRREKKNVGDKKKKRRKKKESGMRECNWHGEEPIGWPSMCILIFFLVDIVFFFFFVSLSSSSFIILFPIDRFPQDDQQCKEQGQLLENKDPNGCVDQQQISSRRLDQCWANERSVARVSRIDQYGRHDDIVLVLLFEYQLESFSVYFSFLVKLLPLNLWSD